MATPNSIALMTTTYIVLRTDGDYPQRGLSMEQAADALLSADGRVYSIEFQDGMFEIRRSTFSRHSPGGAGPLKPVRIGGRFLHPTLRALYAAVLAEEWNGLYAVTDAEHDAMLAALAAEEAEAAADDLPGSILNLHPQQRSMTP